ncbi:unnamed protein product [Cylicostephanus goldi]|uniref:Integrase zinc-binding domain-containing protein n=1 Tax=Cylicostephanus goldi TaxID=71465 RepID=A0A3P7M4Q4_CYLGO|nr:unnamed protein product [Cylicostephanus goldi]
MMDITPTVTSDDDMAAELVLIREHYRESQHQTDNSYLKKLHATYDTDGTIRVDLCMANAQTSGTVRNPILILSSHPLCDKIIAHYHYQLFHAGPSHLITALRERCVTCKRYQGRAYVYARAPDLPILGLHTSPDGSIRSAKLGTGKRGVVEHATNHLLPLEVVEEEDPERDCQHRAKAKKHHRGASRT